MGSRFRGLALVAPFVGAWVEIGDSKGGNIREGVAPFVGAWVEILRATTRNRQIIVAPFVGAWVEMIGFPFHHGRGESRSLCGSVG